MKLTILVLFSFLLSSCYERSDGKLIVVNKSRRNIVFAYSEGFSDSLSLLPPYAIKLNGEALFTGKEEQTENSSFIPPHSEKRMWIFGNWDSVFLDSTFAANKKTSVYILDSDTVKKYKWAEIRHRNLILARAHYFRQKLENQGWRVTYSEDKQGSIK